MERTHAPVEHSCFGRLEVAVPEIVIEPDVP
jgi:hypothetical protein